MSTAHGTADGLGEIRRRIALLEGRMAVPSLENPIAGKEAADRLAFGVSEVDRALGGGLVRAGLHEMRVRESRTAGALAGLGAALLARFQARDGPFLWIIEAGARREGGDLYGPGLRVLGLDPARLLLVRTRSAEEALWAFEEGLRCRALGAVIGEIHAHPRSLDLTASRRLAIRAREEGVMGILLRQGAEAEPSAALTRWLLKPRPSLQEKGFPDGLGRASWQLELERNRLGPTGSFDLEWDHEQRRFVSFARAALFVAGPLSPAQRSVAAPDVGPELALRRAG